MVVRRKVRRTLRRTRRTRGCPSSCPCPCNTKTKRRVRRRAGRMRTRMRRSTRRRRTRRVKRVRRVRRRGMRGGNLHDFASNMFDKAMDKISDIRDVPMEWNGKVGDGVARGAEYASKWGMSGPASGVVKMVDKISGNNPVVDGRSDLSIFDHPVMSKADY